MKNGLPSVRRNCRRQRPSVGVAADDASPLLGPVPQARRDGSTSTTAVEQPGDDLVTDGPFPTVLTCPFRRPLRRRRPQPKARPAELRRRRPNRGVSSDSSIGAGPIPDVTKRETIAVPEYRSGESSTAREAARVARRRAEIEARPSMSPSGPAPGHLHVATWNLNSLRARLLGMERLIERTRPDVLCLQETTTARLGDPARSMFERLGYHVTHVGCGPYNGFAIATTAAPGDIVSSGDFDDEALDREPRVTSCLIATPQPLRVVSVYAPMAAPSTTGTTSTSCPSSMRSPNASASGYATTATSSWRVTSTSATDSDVFHPTPLSTLRMSWRPSGRLSLACAPPASSMSTPPDGSAGPPLHVVEPRHWLFAQPRHAHRPHRQRPRAGRATRHHLDRPCRPQRGAAVGPRCADR